MPLPRKVLFRDLEHLCLGDKLGEGQDRETYIWRPNTALVVKVEKHGLSFQNVSEFRVWQFAVGTHLEEWLAPVRAISLTGRYLLMDRTEPLRRSELPKKVPAFLCDLKLENFGMLNGRMVAHDYGTMVATVRDTPRKLVLADWDPVWSES